MKKILIGAFVGAFIYFAFQSTMWMGGFNNDFTSYAPQQDEVMAGINQHIKTDGLYFMPIPDPSLNLTGEQQQAFHTERLGQPWAMLFYHTEMGDMDPMSIVKGFLYALIAALIVSLVLYHGKFGSFSNRFMVAMGFGVFSIVTGVMDEVNWWDFPWSFIRPQVMDLLLGWGLASLWLAKYVKE